MTMVHPKRKKERKMPRLLILAGLLALFFASYYMYQVFQLMPVAIESNDRTGMFLSLGTMLVMFLLYTNYLLTIFRLSSGSRKAWAGMIRFSFSYILLAILSDRISEMLPVSAAFYGSWILWAMVTIMIMTMMYMMTPAVRRFFTPGYAEEVSLKEWIGYIFWSDPFKGKRMIIT